jgi:hypothetical protein
LCKSVAVLNVQGYTSVIMFSPAHGQYIHITCRRSPGPILQNCFGGNIHVASKME